MRNNNIAAMDSYEAGSQTAPRSIERYPVAITEDVAPLNDGPLLYPDLGEEEIGIVPQAVRSSFHTPVPSDEDLTNAIYNVEYRTSFFSDEDLFHRSNDEYDYPYAVDEEDDAYGQGVFDGHIPSRSDIIMVDLGGQIWFEDEIDLQCFDAIDICDKGDLSCLECQVCGEEYDLEDGDGLEDVSLSADGFQSSPFSSELKKGSPRTKDLQFSISFIDTH